MIEDINRTKTEYENVCSEIIFDKNIEIDKLLKFKNAWEELNNFIYVEQCRKSLPQLKYDAYKEVQHLIQGIKKKHGIEVE